MGIEVIAIRQRNAARAVVECVTDRAAPTRVRHIEPELQSLVAHVAIDVEVADTGFDEGVGVLLADLENAVHPLEVQDHTAGIDRCRAAVGKVAPGRDRVERDGVAIGDGEDLLNLLDRIGSDRRRDDLLLRLFPVGRIRVLVGRYVLVFGDDPLRADCARELL